MTIICTRRRPSCGGFRINSYTTKRTDDGIARTVEIDVHRVACMGCGAAVEGNTRAEAIAKWERRAEGEGHRG